jgi:hypothetical protein
MHVRVRVQAEFRLRLDDRTGTLGGRGIVEIHDGLAAHPGLQNRKIQTHPLDVEA